jgi:serine/threonine protein kinase
MSNQTAPHAGDVIVPYRLTRSIGTGGFSTVFEVVNLALPNQPKFAMKLVNGAKAIKYLDLEYEILRAWDRRFALTVDSDDEDTHVAYSTICKLPAVYWYARYQNGVKACMVMDLAGRDLQQLVAAYTQRGLSVPRHTILHIGMALVRALHQLHQLGYLHNDIKPENIVAGHEDSADIEHVRQLYLLDLGLATRIGAQRPDREGFRGTVAYTSVAGHLLQRACDPRDDIESLMYVLLFMRLQKATWMDVVLFDKKAKRAMVCNWKVEQACITAEELELGQISNTLKYLWSLQNSSQLNYDRILKFLSS